jgi:hypothetical protein
MKVEIVDALTKRGRWVPKLEKEAETTICVPPSKMVEVLPLPAYNMVETSKDNFDFL